MKTKILKPLNLNKKTIVNLKNSELADVKGGACSYEWSGCDTFIRPCCSVMEEWSCMYETLTC